MASQQEAGSGRGQDRPQQRESYRVDIDGHTFGTVNARGEYKARSNFSLELSQYVDGNDAGYFAWVSRKSDGQRRLCFYTTDSVMIKSNFLKEIRTTFGAGGFVCSFNEKELVEFHQFLERSFPFDDATKVKKGVHTAGKQANDVWVVSKDIHIDGKGNLIPLSDSAYSWQPISGPAIDIMVKGNVVGRINLECDVKLPLGSGCLSELLLAMQTVFKHNFIASVYAMASGLMAFHYGDILEEFDACPLPLLCGAPETGKSVAAKCASSPYGQEDVGHMMKTKSTTDTLVTERCCKSTIPFILDDPKSIEGIGEILIDLCNGRQVGNMKVGLRKPRSIPIICANFSMGNIQRYSSRALLIPFKEPSIGPKSTAESLAFANLSRTRKVASRAIGWVISLRKCLVEGGGFREIREMLPTVQEKLPGVDPRLCTGYACLLYFAKKLVVAARMENIYNELEDFLDEISTHVGQNTANRDVSSERSNNHDTNKVVSALYEVASWAEQQAYLYQVLRSVTTRWTFQGREVVAVCFEDIKTSISYPIEEIRMAVKENSMGECNKSKDFVPLGSTNTTIKRSTNNAYSRKATVIWLDVLPIDLKQKLKQVTSTSMSSLPPPDDDIPGSSPPQDKDSSGALHMDDVTLSPPQDKDSSGADASHMDDITLPPWDKDSGASHVDDITLPPRNKDSSGAGALHVDDINLPPQDNDASHVDDVTLEVTKDEDILRQDQDKNTSSGPSHRGNTIPNVPLAPHKNITTIPADPEKDQDPPPPKRRRKHDYTALPKRTTRQNSKAPSWSKRMNAASPLSDQ